ncbi:endonuclease NucS [Candidatus Nanohalobium constans]|uniref:Endonuclease NucS n=1 Tax=Candidatus Nanohalobium constans TaxID=2565781 RepID=A0A5Q0UIV9_9ARCH|nr:endonuclease NucS [Candidatus Nanohalobium constans]QGA80769.1 endonuclease [Candidatus Nanohalobium constans]
MEKLIQNPDFSEAEEILSEYLKREYTVQINGLCAVNYQGRAKSKLDRGERLVIKKQDSAILVHGPDNYQPKNWQPEVDSYTVEIDEEEKHLILEAKRTNPEEVVEIRFEEIELLTVDQMVDKSELKVSGDEVDIHEAIEEEPGIVEEELKVIEREKETPAGFIDVFARDSDDSYVVIEVKRNPDYNTVLQLQRYVDEIEDEFKGGIRGILVAPKMTDKVLDYLEERDLEFVDVEMADVINSYEAIDNSQKGLSDFGADYEV